MEKTVNVGAVVKLSILAGEIMLASGAETNRVEDTMRRILQSHELEDIDAYSTTTGIFATASQGSDIITMMKRVKRKGNNFTKVALVNDLSRRFVAQQIDIESALLTLRDIEKIPPYPTIVRMAGAAVASAGFALMLGGSLTDATAGLLAAFFMQLPVFYLERVAVIAVLRDIVGGFFAALFAMFLVDIGLGHNMDFIVIGAIMPLVPGVSLTNAIRDILAGDFISGSARLLDALLVAVSIAVGVGVALLLNL